jgi:uncharacterized protein YbcI
MKHDSPASQRELSPTAEISRAVVRVHAQFYGRGPTKARTSWTGDHIVCTLEDIYTPAERTLIDAGNFDQVRLMRTAFQDAVEPLLRAAVEDATGRSVRAFFSQISLDPPMAAEVFLLDPPA